MKKMRESRFVRRQMLMLAGAGMLACPALTRATTYTWDGSTTSGSGYFSQPNNWTGNAAPPTSGSNDLIFGSVNTHGYTPTMSSAYSINSLTFNSSALAFVINGGPLTVNAGGITDSSPNGEILTSNNGIVLGASQTWNIAAGALTISSNTLSNSSSSALTKTGAGTLSLALSNSSSNAIGALQLNGGLTQLTAGTLSSYLISMTTAITLTNNAALNISSGAVLQANGPEDGDLSISGNSSVLVTGLGSKFNGTGYTSTVGAGTPGTLTVTTSGSLSALDGLVIGQNASGTLNISSGGTATTAAAIFGYGSSSTGTGTVTGFGSKLTASTELDMGGYSGVAGGAGKLTISSGGTVSTPITQFFTGSSSINISGGALTTGGLGGLNTGTGTIALTADPSGGYALNLNGSMGTNTYYGFFSGTGTLNKTGGSTQVLASNVTFDGQVIISGGALTANGLLTVDNTSLMNLSGGTLNINAGLTGYGSLQLTDPVGAVGLNIGGSGYDAEFDGSIYGSGSLTKNGAGEEQLEGSNSFTGPVSVYGGTLQMSSGSASSYLASGGTLELDSGVIPSTATVGSAGVLSGAANYSNVTINAGGTFSPGGAFGGTAQGGNNSAITPVPGAVVSSANLNITAATTTIGISLSTSSLTLNGNINASSAAVTRTGAGTLNLNGQSITFGSLSLQGGATQLSGGQTTISNSTGLLLQSASLTLTNAATLVDNGPATFNTSDASVVVNGAAFEVTALKSSTTGYGSLSLTNPALVDDGDALEIVSPNAATSTYSGSISGTGTIYKDGRSIQILSGNNSGFSGTVYVADGTLEMTSSGSPYFEAASGGTIKLDYGTLGFAAVTADGGGTVIYNASTISGGTLLGGGTHNVAAVQDFISTTFANGVSITPANYATLTGVNNQGTINNPAGTYLFISGANAGGTLNLSGQAYISNFTSSGILQVNAGCTLTNSSSNLLLLGGSQTYIGSSSAPGGYVELSQQTIQLNGGLLANYGTIADGVVDVNYGGLATGTGSYGSGVVVNPGGTYLPGNYGTSSPVAVLGSPFAMIQPATSGATTATPAVTVATQAMITVNTGDTLTLAGGLNASGQSVTKLAGGTLITAPFSASNLNVSAGSVSLSPAASVLSLGTLEVNSSATLDLSSDSADISTTTLSSVTALAKLGFANGKWNGIGGIISSTASTDTKHLTAIGVIQNNQNGSAVYNSGNKFQGTVPGTADVLLAYTYYGDANLDGQVDGSDYTLIDHGFSAHLTGWLNGDFNYDGKVDGSDYTLIDNAFNTQGAKLAALIATSTAQIAGTSAVPEPASMVATFAALGMLIRRKRNV
jgi:fibronectin-binding autotransporter adhesin